MLLNEWSRCSFVGYNNSLGSCRLSPGWPKSIYHPLSVLSQHLPAVESVTVLVNYTTTHLPFYQFTHKMCAVWILGLSALRSILQVFCSALHCVKADSCRLCLPGSRQPTGGTVGSLEGKQEGEATVFPPSALCFKSLSSSPHSSSFLLLPLDGPAVVLVSARVGRWAPFALPSSSLPPVQCRQQLLVIADLPPCSPWLVTLSVLVKEFLFSTLNFCPFEWSLSPWLSLTEGSLCDRHTRASLK